MVGKENLCLLNFETPRKVPGGVKPETLDYFSGSGLFDDDFDDSILEQIDVLCEEKSGVKAAEQVLDHRCQEKVSSEIGVVGNADLSLGTSGVYKGIRNDDFDDSILEQIDILREEKSAGKAAGHGLDHSCREKVLSEISVVGDIDIGLGTSAISNGVEDFDFDESILEQIDMLCEQKSAVKAFWQGLDDSCHEKVLSESGGVANVDLVSGTSSVSKGIGNGDMFSHGIALDLKEEHVHSDGTRQGLLSGTMPEEYSKYLVSLNDRQREAACTDVSTPLMIVAGPGSGKVFINSAFFNILFLL